MTSSDIRATSNSPCPACGGPDYVLAWQALNDAWMLGYSVQFSAHRVIVGSAHYTREQYGSIAAAFIAASRESMIEYMVQEEQHERFDEDSSRGAEMTSSEIRATSRANDNAERLLMVALIVENPELGVSLRDALADRNRNDERE